MTIEDAQTRGAHIDVEVTQRLLKSADFAVLGMGAIFLSLRASAAPRRRGCGARRLRRP